MEPDLTCVNLDSHALKLDGDLEAWRDEARGTLLEHLEDGAVQV